MYVYVSKLAFSLLFGLWGQGAQGEEKGNCIDQQRTVDVLFSQLLTLPCKYWYTRKKLSFTYAISVQS